MRSDLYERIRGIIDSRFTAWVRRCRQTDPGLERMELWQDLMQAGMQAADALPGADDTALESTVIEAVELRVATLCGD